MKLSEKIYQGRKSLGLSQEAFAEKLGVSRQAVSKWETGEATPELYKIPMMAKLFSVSTDYLLTEEEDFSIEPLPIEEKEEAPAPDTKPKPKNNNWVIGLVLSLVGLGMVVVCGGVLLISAFLFGTVVHEDGIYVDSSSMPAVAIESEWVFPDQSEEVS